MLPQNGAKRTYDLAEETGWSVFLAKYLFVRSWGRDSATIGWYEEGVTGHG